jgi:hypothetical protein
VPAVALLSQKGGAGKTTFAVHLAVASGNALIIDGQTEICCRVVRTGGRASGTGGFKRPKRQTGNSGNFTTLGVY